MERNFCEEIYLEDLEKLSSMSRSTLQRRFRSVTGVPPMVYLNRIRLRRAAELLLNTDFRIKEIADQSGFFRTPYFFQSFRDCYGIVRDPEVPVEKVVFRAFGKEASYMRDLPLHHSQKEMLPFGQHPDGCEQGPDLP